LPVSGELHRVYQSWRHGIVGVSIGIAAVTTHASRVTRSDSELSEHRPGTEARDYGALDFDVVDLVVRRVGRPEGLRYY